MGRLLVWVAGFLALLLLQADAAAGRRVALIIGNGSYQQAGTLANPVNDATDMAAKLTALGFQVVDGHDLGKRDLERRIGDFADALQGADVGLFFYSGHGLQVDGRNYIVPVDAHLDVPVKLQLEAVPIDEVLDIMEQQTKVSLVFLDACRNNPFARSLSNSTRSAAPLAGLAQFDSTRGSFIAFSTAPGSVAMDGSGRNSPFVSALLEHIAEPGLSINDLMIEVRRDVVAATRDFQRPWEQGSLLERFEFVPAAGGEAVSAVQPAPEQPAATAAPVAPAPQVATLERSVGSDSSIESFVRDAYLVPDNADMTTAVKKLYSDPATIFGSPLGMDALVQAKVGWFAQWSSWTLGLTPGSLKVTPRGEDRADVLFDMTYDYVPKANPASHVAGKARVSLGLVMQGGAWHIATESSQAIQ